MGSELHTEKQGGFIAMLMAFVAGFIDAVGYIVLFHMFTANMSGNSVALGIDIGQRKWSGIMHRAFPIPFFMLGMILGSLIIVISTRKGVRNAFPVVFFLEAFLICLFCLLGESGYSRSAMHILSPDFYLIAALPAVAMGLQTAVLHRAGSLTFRTTFVTGMISSSCREFVNYLFWLKDHNGRGGKTALFLRSLKQAAFVRMALTGGVWIFYMIGAIASGALLLFWGLNALFIPAGILLTAAAVLFKVK